MSRKEEKLNNEAAAEKKKIRKSVVSWFVEEEEETPSAEAGAEADYTPLEYSEPEEKAPEATGKAVEAAAAGRSGKEKKSKKKKSAEAASGEPAKKKRRIPGFLVFLIIVAVIAAGLYIHIRTDIHDKTTENRGTVIGDTYCYYSESRDEIVRYSTSSGPKVVKNTDEDFEKLFAKLKPIDRSSEWTDRRDEVAAAMGSSFDATKYKYIDAASKCVLFSYPNNGQSALWIYNEKYRTVEPVVTGNNIRGIAFGNMIIYARDDDKNATVCYRVSTSYSGQILSVDEFRTVSKSPVTFWSSTFWDFVKGLARGLKASTDSRK